MSDDAEGLMRAISGRLGRRPAFVLAVVTPLLVFSRAAAHPHVWIDAEATFRLDEGKLDAIDVAWHLDPAVSSTLRADWDADGNGSFDPEEQAALARDIFPGLAEYDYFAHLRLAGEPVELLDADSFVPTLDGDVATYAFRLHLPLPVRPEEVPVVLGLYDETFYVDIAYEAASIRVEGEGAERCRTEIADDPDNPIYYGLVIPKKISLVCAPP